MFDDADIDAAVAGIGTAGYFNAGQDCTAATRVLVDANVHDEFVAEMVKWAKENAKTGCRIVDDILFGLVNNANQLERVSGIIDALPSSRRSNWAVTARARAATSTRRPSSRGLKPTDDAHPERDLRPHHHAVQ